MKPQAAQVNVVAMAVRAFVWTLAGVQALVQLEMDELGELGWAEFAVVGLLTRVQAQVSFQVAGAAEALVTNLEEEAASKETTSAAGSDPPPHRYIWLFPHSSGKSAKMKGLVVYLAFMWFLPSVDQEVLLQVSQLGEAFVAGLTFKRSLSTVDTKMNLQSRERGGKSFREISCGCSCLCKVFSVTHLAKLLNCHYESTERNVEHLHHAEPYLQVR